MMKIRHSLRKKLTLVLLAALILSIGAAGLVLYGYLKDYLRRQTVAENVNLIYQGGVNIQNQLDSLLLITLQPYSNQNMYSALTRRPGKEDFTDDQALQFALATILEADNNIQQVHLYAAGRNQNYLRIKGDFRSVYRQSFTYAQAGELAYEVLPTHDSTSYGLSVSPRPATVPVITLRRPLQAVPQKTWLGVLEVDVRLDGLALVCEKIRNHPDEQVYLYNQDGALIWSTEAQLAPGLAEGVAAAGQAGLWYGGDDSAVVYHTIEVAGGSWVLAKLMPPAVLYASVNHLVVVIFLIMAVACAVAGAAMVVITHRFTSPITRLAEHIGYIREGHLTRTIAISRDDEIGLLYTQFQELMDTINNLVLREYRLEAANRSHQLKALQAQLDPHFLNNAMQSISTQALRDGSENVYALLVSFASMMNYSMRLDVDFAPLSAELAHVENYLKLQKQRFEDDLHYRIEAAEEVLNVPVPVMTVQPLVENYFKHGFVKKPEGYLVCVRAALAEGGLVIEVEDNGSGIPPGRLAEVRENLRRAREEQPLPGAGGIGLGNVATRLALYYGEAGTLEIENVAGGGALVRVRIPAGERPGPA